MFFLLCILIGVVYGLFKKYNRHSKHEQEFTINKINLIYIILGIQVLFRLGVMATNSNIILVSSVGIGLVLTSFHLFYNRRNTPITLIELGYISNCIVMLFNGGKMPTLVDEAVQLDIRHISIDNSGNLLLLSDIIHLPYPLDYGNYLLSIGDVMIGIGIMLLVGSLLAVSKKTINN